MSEEPNDMTGDDEVEACNYARAARRWNDMIFDDKIRAATILHIPHAAYAIPCFSGYTLTYERIWKEIELLTDWCSEQIFDVPGVTTLTCPWSRVFCDVERLLTPDEPMEASGMGFFYTKCDDGSDLRLEGKKGVNRNFAMDYYKAHHDSLRRLVQDKIDEYGQCHIIDCHSFSAIPHRRETIPPGHPRPDICLGTGVNTPGYVLEHWMRVFMAASRPQNFDDQPSTKTLSVGIDTPYSGSMVPLDFVGDERVTSIMIEVNRGLWDNGRNRHETKDPVLCIRNLVRKGLAFEML